MFGGNGVLASGIQKYLESFECRLGIADISHNASNIKNYWKCDARSPSSVANVLSDFSSIVGHIDALVNLVGFIANKPFYNPMGTEKYMEDSYWQNMMDVNLNTAFILTKEYHKYAIEHKMKCNMINFSSVTASGNRGQIAYSVSKAAIESLTRNLAMELGPRGHRFNAISPGYIDVSSTRQNVSDEKLKAITDKISLRKLGNIESIGKTVKFILDTDYLNGQTVKVDGGFF
jgi:3-oxoacyl-[acyl-carrier protein] reductase